MPNEAVGAIKSSIDGNSLLERLESWAGVLTRPIAFIGVLGMLVVSAVTVADVLLRWLANSGVLALNEITTLTFAVAVAACMPSGLARGVHVVVDIFKDSYFPRLRAQLQAVGAFLLLVMFFLIAWRLYLYAGRLADRVTGVLAIPEAPFIYATSVLFALAAVVQTIITANAVQKAINYRSSGDPIHLAGGSSRASVFVAVLGSFVFALVAWGIFDFSGFSSWALSNQGTTLIVAFLVMWGCLLALVPLAAVLGLIGIVGTATVIGIDPALGAFSGEVARFLTDYQIATLPLFLMMGSFAALAGVANDVYRLAQAVVGSLRGGLALATIAGCAGFGTVTGSSLATIVTFGRISLPEMRARGYAPSLATGCVAAGGNLGALIPPSGPLILFALLTEASIGQLFIAAIIPGILAYILYSAAVMTYAYIYPTSLPPASKMDFGELVAAAKQCGAVIALFGVVIGGMYTGVFTATESAAVGAFFAFLLALVRGRLRLATLWQVMGETTASTALIYTLIFGALSFSFFVGLTSLPEQMTQAISDLDVPPLAIIVFILLIYIMLGCIMDSFAIMVITVPIVTPLILFFGYDIVWWGIINLVIVEMSTLTPPFGIHVFVLKALVPDVPIATIFKGVMTFVAADIVKIAILVLFPILALWLPSTMH